MPLKAESKLTLAKLAELAGVSTSTASRALKDNPLIKEETRTRIQALAREHNFKHWVEYLGPRKMLTLLSQNGIKHYSA